VPEESPTMNGHSNHGNGIADPCIEEFTEHYLHRSDVIKAIHAPASKQWQKCGQQQSFAYTKSVLDKYRLLIQDDKDNSAQRLKILVYSGDVDSVVATVGTRGWIDSLHLAPHTKWRPWMQDKQLAGFTQSYQGGFLTFATVREAGHEVPQYQPERALEMFESFISTQAIP